MIFVTADSVVFLLLVTNHSDTLIQIPSRSGHSRGRITHVTVGALQNSVVTDLTVRWLKMGEKWRSGVLVGQKASVMKIRNMCG